MQENVIIEFTSDIAGLEPAIDLLQKIGKISAEDAAAAKKMAAEWKAQQQAISQGTQQSVSQVEKFTASYKNLISKIQGGAIENTFNDIIAVMKQLDPTSAKLIEDFQKIGQTEEFVSRASSVLKHQLEQMAATGQKGTTDYNNLDAAINKLETSIKELGDESNKSAKKIKAPTDELSKFGNVTTSIRTRIRVLREEMAALEANGESNTKRFRELQAEAGRLTDNFGDVQTSINYLASDTKELDSLLSLGSGLAGTFNIVTSAAALFGGKNEELQQAFLKCQAALQILNGVQAVANTLNKNSALIEGIKHIQTLATARATDLKTQATIRATIAQKAYNLVAKANPYVLLATAIITVAGAVGVYYLATSKARAEQKAFNQELENSSKLFKQLDFDTQTAVERLDAQGAGEIAKFRVQAETTMKKYQVSRKLYEDSLKHGTKEQQKELFDQVNDAANAHNRLVEQSKNYRIKSGREYAQKEREAGAEYNKLRLEDDNNFLQEIMSSETNSYDSRLNAAKQYYDNQIAIINAEEKRALSDKTLGENQRKLVEENARQARENAATEWSNNVNIIEQTEYDRRIKSIEQYQKDRQGVIDEAYQKELTDLSAIFAKGELKEEEYEKKKLEIQRKYNKLSAETEIEIIQWALDTQQLTIEQTEQLYKQLSDAKKRLAKETADAEIDENERAAQKTLERRKALQDALKELLYAQFEFAGQLLQMKYDNYKALLDQQLYDLQNFYTTDAEEAAKNKNKKLISEEELARRTAEIKQKQAKADKDNAIAQAVINAGLAITKVFASTPPPASFILAGITAAATAIQIAAIKNQPIPKYWKGRKGGAGEYAMVGEHGPEMMWIPQGASILPSHKTNTMLKAMDIAKQYRLPALNALPLITPNTIKTENTGQTTISIDYDRLGKTIAKNSPEISQFNVNMDEDGFGKYLLKNNSTTTLLNKRFEL